MTALSEVYVFKCLGEHKPCESDDSFKRDLRFQMPGGTQTIRWFCAVYIFLFNARSQETPQFGEPQKIQQGTKRLLIDTIASTPCLPSGTKESCINTSSPSTSTDKHTVIRNPRSTHILSFQHWSLRGFKFGVRYDFENGRKCRGGRYGEQ